MTPLRATIAAVAVAALAAAAVLTRADAPATPRALERPLPARTPVSNPPSPASRRADGAIVAARRYALIARNWTASTYPAAWRGQLALAAGPYRRQLDAARPTRVQVRALRSDDSSNLAVAVRVRRDPTVAAPRARVVVWLAERTVAAGQTMTGITRNEVHLRRIHRRWRVIGWTALPGSDGDAP